MESELRRLARIGYEAYGDKAEWKNFSGDKMPSWDEVPEHIKEKWEAAVSAVVRSVGERLPLCFGIER